MLVALPIALLIGGGTYASLLLSSGGGNINLQNGLVGHWKLDGNALDSSPYGNNGTATGTASTTDEQGGADKALSFAGTTSSLVTINPENDFPSSSISTAFWAKTSTTGRGIVSYSVGSGSGQDNEWLIFNPGNLTIYREVSNASTGVNIADNNWHHIVVTWRASDGQTKVYKDGSLAATITLTTSLITNGGCLIFAQDQDSLCGGLTAGQAMNGSLDDVRLYNRVISPDEINALYQQYSPQLNVASGEKGLVGRWKFDGNAKDSTPYANNGTVNGATLNTDRQGATNNAYSFNGTSNSITMSNSNGRFMGTNNTPFSLSMWINPNNLSTTWRRSIATTGGYLTNGFRMGTDGNNKVNFWTTQSGGTGNLTSNAAISTGQWYLATVTFDGTTANMYINGSSSGSTALTYIGSSATINLGTIGGMESYSGSMDDVRLYNRALSPTEASNLYSSYDSQVNLYRSAGSGGSGADIISGLKGQWNFSGNAKDATPYSNNGTVNGATLTTDRYGSANSAYSFNGTSAYVALPNNAYNALSSGSISAWVKMTVRPGAGSGYSIFTTASASSSNNLLGLGLYGVGASDTRLRVGSNSPTSNYVYGDTSLVPGTWHHVVLTSNGSTWNLYVNGALQTLTVQQGSNAGYFFNSQVSGTMRYDIGVLNRSSGFLSYFNGSVDDVRVYNRALDLDDVQALYNLAE